MEVGAPAVPIEDRDEFRRAVDGGERVRRHGGELGGLTGLDGDLAVAEPQAHPPLEHEEPVVTRVDPGRLRPARGALFTGRDA